MIDIDDYLKNNLNNLLQLISRVNNNDIMLKLIDLINDYKKVLNINSNDINKSYVIKLYKIYKYKIDILR